MIEIYPNLHEQSPGFPKTPHASENLTSEMERSEKEIEKN